MFRIKTGQRGWPGAGNASSKIGGESRNVALMRDVVLNTAGCSRTKASTRARRRKAAPNNAFTPKRLVG